MRILYVITRSEMGGAQMVVLTYLRYLANSVEVAVVTGDEGFLTKEARSLGIPVFVLPDLVAPIAPRRDYRAVRALYRLISAYQPDLVHVHSSKAGLLGRVAARLAGIPSVFTAHGFAFTENTSFLRKTLAIPSEWLGAKLGQSIIAVSEYDTELAARYRILPSNGVHVVHNGLTDIYLPIRPTDGSPVNIVMVARFAPQKDHECFLKAAAGLQSDFRVWFVGDGPTILRVRAEAIRLGLEGRTTFFGARSDVPELLAKAHIFVLASNYEGLPITILEAMRAGLPVVASDVGGVRECVTEGSTGFLVRRGDSKSMQERLHRLITSPSLRAQMGRRGRRSFEEHFSADAMIQKTSTIYKALLEPATKRAPAADEHEAAFSQAKLS